ncbi:MAG: MotA/TolQ/ExbB proton channel family protein [Gammaproteobacteria bacterium]|nr:MAG: MotA/TolQ/ExbB proton channel family protein [Gammaproteobacteria bacterium]
MIDIRHNYSGRTLIRLIVLGIVALLILLVNVDFIQKLYLEHQLTYAGLLINGGIILIFLLGLVKMIIVLVSYMREETDLAHFVEHLKKGNNNPLKAVSVDSIIARRYKTIVRLSKRHARINQSALAATLVADEGTRISFTRYVSNILILTGVFGTIVSLSIALVGASDLLDTAKDTANMSLVIHGMSMALSTTITAILCYLFYGYFYLKLGDAQAHLLAGVEEVTTVYLIPIYAHDKDTMLHEVSGLVHGLRQTAEVMKAVQLNYAEAGVRMQEMIKNLGQQISRTSEDTAVIKQLLRDGFRLPAEDD